MNSQVRECLVRLCHQGWRPLAEEPPSLLREVDRLTRNPEKLADTGGRCWKDTLGRKRSFRTHWPPYSTWRGLVTTWQETKKLSQDEIWMDNVREDLKDKRNRKQPGLGSDQDQKWKSGGVLWQPHRRLFRRWRERKKKMETWEISGCHWHIVLACTVGDVPSNSSHFAEATLSAIFILINLINHLRWGQ